MQHILIASEFNISQKNLMFIGNRNITANCFRVQASNSAIWGCFCIGFIDYMLKGKSLLEYTNLFSQLLNLSSTVIGCVSIVGIPVGIASSAIAIEIFVMTAGIKKNKSIIKKKRKRNMTKQWCLQKMLNNKNF